jgi:hypothetical protein
MPIRQLTRTEMLAIADFRQRVRAERNLAIQHAQAQMREVPAVERFASRYRVADHLGDELVKRHRRERDAWLTGLIARASGEAPAPIIEKRRIVDLIATSARREVNPQPRLGERN